MILDEHQHKLYDTDREPYNLDNNRNHCQSFQAFYLLLYQDLAKGKANRPVWGSHVMFLIPITGKLLKALMFLF